MRLASLSKYGGSSRCIPPMILRSCHNLSPSIKSQRFAIENRVSPSLPKILLLAYPDRKVTCKQIHLPLSPQFFLLQWQLIISFNYNCSQDTTKEHVATTT